MAERFQKLYSLPSNLYSTAAPVIISAGSLLKDTETGKMIVQIKYHCVSSKKIKALKVDIAAFDITGAELEGVTGYQYLDLSVHTGDEFGANKAIVLPDVVTRSFQISCLSVVFFDGEVCDVDLPLSELSQPKTLLAELKNAELVKQYQIAVNDCAKYVPQEIEGLWMCSCGTWNSCEVCTNCFGKKKEVQSSLNIEWLKACADQRIAIEQTEYELQQEKSKATQIKVAKENRNRKRIIIISIISAILLIGIVSGIVSYSSQHKYDTIAGVYVLQNAAEAESAIYKVNKDLIDEYGFNAQSYKFEIKGSGKIYGLWFVNKKGSLTPRAATIESLSDDGTCIVSIRDYPDAKVTITVNLASGTATYYSSYGKYSLSLAYKKEGTQGTISNNTSEAENTVVYVRGLNATVPSGWKVYDQASENLGRASIGEDNEYRSWYISYKGQYSTFSDFAANNPNEIYEAGDESQYRKYQVSDCKEGYIATTKADGVLVIDFYVVCNGHVFNLTYTSHLNNDDISKTEATKLLKCIDFAGFIFK